MKRIEFKEGTLRITTIQGKVKGREASTGDWEEESGKVKARV